MRHAATLKGDLQSSVRVEKGAGQIQSETRSVWSIGFLGTIVLPWSWDETKLLFYS